MPAIERTFRPDDGKTLPCREGDERTEYHESASGLRLRVTRLGSRTWLVLFWSATAARTRRLNLGDGATMSLKKAREAARAALAAVETEGRDPYAERIAEREREREERRRRADERRRVAAERARRTVTFGKLCAEYVEYRRTTPSGRYKRPARPNTLATWEPMLRLHVLPVVGDMPPEDVTSEDFLRVLEGAAKRGGPSMGPRVRELLSAVWRWIEQRPRMLGVKLPPVSPMRELPRDVGAATRERERVLSPAEVRRFWRATEGEGLEGEALRFMLLTAARVREATGLPWSELDLKAKVWRLPAERSKGGRARLLPLSDEALTLLKRVRALGTTDYVFGIAGLRVSESMVRVRTAMGGEPWQPRDLRRTAATLCARLGADPFVVALVLGHAKPDIRMPDVTRTYLRWNYEEKVREALARLGAWVADTVSCETEPGEVVAFESKGRA
jgi:integrase